MLRLYAAGSNARGQLAAGHCEDLHTFEPALFACEDGGTGYLPSHVLGLACGANHTLVLLNTHELWVSGDSSHGQLASLPSTTVFRKLLLDLTYLSPALDHSFKPVAVAAGWETSYVVFSSSSELLSDILISFGADDFGDRGAGSPSPAPRDPIVVDLRQALAGSPRRIKVRELVAGQHHVLANLEVWRDEGPESDFKVVGWGACRHGQLGDVPSPKPARSIRARVNRGDRPTSKVDRPRAVETCSTEPPIKLAVGSQHSLVLHSTCQFSTLGSSRHGQLDIPSAFLKPDEPSRSLKTIGCTWSSSFFVSHLASSPSTTTNPPWHINSCGSSNHGQLGRQALSSSHISGSDTFGSVDLVGIPRSSAFLKLICGSEHVLLYTSDGVWGWGWNEHGNLGIGHTEDVSRPQKIFGSVSGNKTVLDVWAGCGTSWILVEEG